MTDDDGDTVDAELYPTVARLLPLHRDVLELVLSTTFTDWPDNIATAIANTVPPVELAPLFVELAAFLRAELDRLELDVNDAVHVDGKVQEFEERAKLLEDGPSTVSAIRPRKKK